MTVRLPVRGSHGAWVVLLLLALVGCASRESGYKISEETIAFIQPGVTTRSEVIENLGPPLLELKPERVVVYSWGKIRPVITRARPIQDPALNTQGIRNPVQPGEVEDPGEVETKRWVCCVACDANDLVRRVERLQLEGDGASLEQAVRRWFESIR